MDIDDKIIIYMLMAVAIVESILLIVSKKRNDNTYDNENVANKMRPVSKPEHFER